MPIQKKKKKGEKNRGRYSGGSLEIIRKNMWQLLFPVEKNAFPNFLLHSPGSVLAFEACLTVIVLLVQPQKISSVLSTSFGRKLQMAQFTVQVRLKLLFNGDGISSRLEQKDPFDYKLRPLQTHNRKLWYFGSSGRLLHYPSSLSGKSSRCNAGARPTVSNEGVYHSCSDHLHDEFEDDDLACFRGLILDISYRSVSEIFTSLSSAPQIH